eukprot:5703710-Pyramimonas_sp.AAC.2
MKPLPGFGPGLDHNRPRTRIASGRRLADPTLDPIDSRRHSLHWEQQERYAERLGTAPHNARPVSVEVQRITRPRPVSASGVPAPFTRDKARREMGYEMGKSPPQSRGGTLERNKNKTAAAYRPFSKRAYSKVPPLFYSDPPISRLRLHTEIPSSLCFGTLRTTVSLKTIPLVPKCMTHTHTIRKLAEPTTPAAGLGYTYDGYAHDTHPRMIDPMEAEQRRSSVQEMFQNANPTDRQRFIESVSTDPKVSS